MSGNDDEATEPHAALTQDQISRMEKNRKRAMAIREAKEKGAKM